MRQSEVMSYYAQKPKLWNVEPYFNHPQKEITEISPSMIETLVPHRFPMDSWSGIGSSILCKLWEESGWWVAEMTSHPPPQVGYRS